MCVNVFQKLKIARSKTVKQVAKENFKKNRYNHDTIKTIAKVSESVLFKTPLEAKENLSGCAIC